MFRCLLLVPLAALVGCADPHPAPAATADDDSVILLRGEPMEDAALAAQSVCRDETSHVAVRLGHKAHGIDDDLPDDACTDPGDPANWPLRFDSIRHDFGTITDVSGLQRHQFVYENVSGRTIRLAYPQEVFTSCGYMSQRIIEPGETGVIRAALNPRRRSGRVTRTLILHWRWADAGEPVCGSGD